MQARLHILDVETRVQPLLAGREVLRATGTMNPVNIYKQLAFLLRQNGEQPPATICSAVWEVVADLPMPQGFDLAAAEADHSARYGIFRARELFGDHPGSSFDNDGHRNP